MTSTRPAMPADSIVAIHDQAAAVHEILSGTLDDKIAELKVLQADVTARQGIVKTVAAADKYKADVETAAKAQLAQAELTLNGAKMAAKKMTDEATAKTALADERAKTLSDLSVRLGEQKQSTAVWEADLKAYAVKLDDRQNSLIARENAVQAKEAKLTKDIAAFNLRLDALKA